MQHGLKPIRKDHRQYSFHRTFRPKYGSVSVIGIPDELNVDAGLTMPDQDADGLPFGCTGETTCDLCNNEDNAIYDPASIYRWTQEKEGTLGQLVGCDIRDSLGVAVNIGVKKAGEPDSAAATRKRGAYFDVLDGSGLPPADAIRSAIWTCLSKLQQRRAVSVGTPWFPEWSRVGKDGLIPATFKYSGKPDDYQWHNWAISGTTKLKDPQGKLRYIVKSWQGKKVGDNGLLYMLPETLNAALAIGGTGAFNLAPKDNVDIKTVRLGILATMLSLCQQALQLMLKLAILPAMDPDTFMPWDGPENNRHNIRVLCDLAGLSRHDKNVITACIQQESGFYNYLPNGKPVTHVNRRADNSVSSTDWGICQINDRYHIGPNMDFPSVDFVMANPDKAVGYMISMFKAGKLGLWVSYTSGAFLQFMPK